MKPQPRIGRNTSRCEAVSITTGKRCQNSAKEYAKTKTGVIAVCGKHSFLDINKRLAKMGSKEGV